MQPQSAGSVTCFLSLLLHPSRLHHKVSVSSNPRVGLGFFAKVPRLRPGLSGWEALSRAALAASRPALPCLRGPGSTQPCSQGPSWLPFVPLDFLILGIFRLCGLVGIFGGRRWKAGTRFKKVTGRLRRPHLTHRLPLYLLQPRVPPGCLLPVLPSPASLQRCCCPGPQASIPGIPHHPAPTRGGGELEVGVASGVGGPLWELGARGRVPLGGLLWWYRRPRSLHEAASVGL